MRAPEERDRDRDDLLAALDAYGASMATRDLIAAANGTYANSLPQTIYARGYADLRWLERAGLIVSEFGVGGAITRWQRRTGETVDRRSEEEDYYDVQRMYAQWEEVVDA